MLYLDCEWGMKKKFLDVSMDSIRRKYPEYSKEKLEEIEYGIEALYITFTKMVVIALISILLGVIKEIFFILVFYNIIRTTAFGMHAKTSLQCYIISILLFVGLAIVSKYVNISLYLKILISIICFINIVIFAPADTYKRPLINRKRRHIYKVISILISLIYVILIVIFHTSIFSTYILFGLLNITLMIHPLTYRMFQLPYNNYKNYAENL